MCTDLIPVIAYRGEYKNRLKFLCLLEFQFHNTLRLLLLSINYIQLQRKSNKTQGLKIKTKWILGLKLGQIQEHSYDVCIAERLPALSIFSFLCFHFLYSGC